MEVAKASLKQAGKVCQMLPPKARRGLAVELERLEGLLGRVVRQTERRVLDDESRCLACRSILGKDREAPSQPWRKPGR